MTFATVCKGPNDLQVGDLVLAYVSGDGHGANFQRLVTTAGDQFSEETVANGASANLPAVSSITYVAVDTSTSWTTQAQLEALDYTGPGAGELITETTDVSAPTNQGPVHVNLQFPVTDLVDAPSHSAPWFDQNMIIVVATG
jgi:hypothetical protein